MGRDVFIAYHESDSREVVYNIADSLAASGISCWYMERDSLNFDSYTKNMLRLIKNCRVFLLILSEKSNRSQVLKRELAFAFSQDVSNKQIIRLVPFQIDDCVLDDDMLYYLARVPIVNGNPPDSQHIQDLTKRIARLLEKKSARGFRFWSALKNLIGIDTG